MNHGSMLKNGRMELWGDFDQAGDAMSFASSENFVIAFMGSGQVAYFDGEDSGFAGIDPAYGSVEIIDYPVILEESMSFRISRGILTGLQDVLGIHELSDCAEALAVALGITMAQLTPGTPQLVASCVTTLMEIISVIQCACTVADSVGGIYSTAMGAGNKYDKAEAFAHDATMMAVSLILIWGTLSALKNCVTLFKSASQNLIGRTSRLTPSEVTQTYKGAKLLTSFEEFAEYAKGFLEEDALQYAKEALTGDADDIAKLKKVAQLVEDGSKKIGKKLSKEELKAGLDALWDNGGVEGALEAIERINKSSILGIVDGKTPAAHYADQLRGLSKSKRPNTAAVVRTADGKYYGGYNKAGISNSNLQKVLDYLGNENIYNRQCAEINAISKALNEGADLKGATISVAHVRKANDISGIHGTYKQPCDVCQPLLDFLGIRDIH